MTKWLVVTKWERGGATTLEEFPTRREAVSRITEIQKYFPTENNQSKLYREEEI